MQHAAPATQHAPAAVAKTLEEPTNAATAAKNFKDLDFMNIVLMNDTRCLLDYRLNAKFPQYILRPQCFGIAYVPTACATISGLPSE
jgi:hypothetical protein